MKLLVSLLFSQLMALEGNSLLINIIVDSKLLLDYNIKYIFYVFGGTCISSIFTVCYTIFLYPQFSEQLIIDSFNVFFYILFYTGLAHIIYWLFASHMSYMVEYEECLYSVCW